MTAPGVEYWSGQLSGWRYLAFRIDGLGTPRVLLEGELPVQDVTLTDVLSGPPQMQATIEPRFARLIGSDGLPLLKPWQTAIFAEKAGLIRQGGILVSSTYDGPSWNLDVSGFSGYPKGQPYEGDVSFVATDPLVIVRHVWTHLQSQPGRNMGLTIDDTSSPVKVGKALPTGTQDTSGTPSADDGPYRLARWQNHDLMQAIDDLADATPFDYHERWEWDPTKAEPRGYIDLGYPRMGQRRDLRFVLGENVQVVPEIEDDGEGFADDVRVLGAGEGSAMLIGRATQPTAGLRRTKTLDRKDVTDLGRLNAIARQELASALLLTTTPTVTVLNTPAAPLGAWGVGDEIRLQVDTDGGGWRGLDLWFRVLSQTITPESPNIVTMTLLRSDLVR